MRVAVLGAGAVGSRAARQLASTPSVRHLVVSDVDRSRAEAVVSSIADPHRVSLGDASADGVASLLLELHAARQTILVVVTHSAALADRFPRRYEMNRGSLEGIPAP